MIWFEKLPLITVFSYPPYHFKVFCAAQYHFWFGHIFVNYSNYGNIQLTLPLTHTSNFNFWNVIIQMFACVSGVFWWCFQCRISGWWWWGSRVSGGKSTSLLGHQNSLSRPWHWFHEYRFWWITIPSSNLYAPRDGNTHHCWESQLVFRTWWWRSMSSLYIYSLYTQYTPTSISIHTSH